jgi:cytochrome P450
MRINRTIILGGHETTAHSICWTLYELAKAPHVQHRMRVEIQEMQAKISARGDTEFTVTDFDNMPYTIAVMKVDGFNYRLRRSDTTF